ncbi:hypothetical protein [Pseudoalteromonas sp. Of7M-16]|uniref:hypothetical protein n=1 Tax=Pseudoalteromonas sp. Of7M-16 TaxID=2917756 RepID=UPI001EF40E32|nr:hypothetical protein [Pseudoalteromonas sp. Of7M-16]MCG7550959.1 hypothetical protein [Pseudoalteromonas sp. Of7M-16]
MTNEQIRQLALANGFKLKEQPNGEMDLNPYVYQFAKALIGEQMEVIHERNEKLSSCKLLAEYVLKQTEGAELKNQNELFSLVTDIEYEVHQLLVEEF